MDDAIVAKVAALLDRGVGEGAAGEQGRAVAPDGAASGHEFGCRDRARPLRGAPLAGAVDAVVRRTAGAERGQDAAGERQIFAKPEILPPCGRWRRLARVAKSERRYRGARPGRAPEPGDAAHVEGVGGGIIDPLFIGGEPGVGGDEQVDGKFQHRAIGFEDKVLDRRQPVGGRAEQLDIEFARGGRVERISDAAPVFDRRNRRADRIDGVF